MADETAPQAGSPEDELRQMVQSLDDLEAEHNAGNLDDDDYRRLQDEYTVRVADAMRRLARPAGKVATDAEEPRRRFAGVGGSLVRNWKMLVAMTGLLVLAVGAGWVLARSTGERGVGDALTGSIDESPPQQVARCHDLAMESAKLLESLQCFDAVLADDPHNVEALTYRAWYLVLASGADDIVTPEQEADLLASASDYLDQAVLVDPQYPDARTFRAVVADRQGRPEAVCVEIAILLGLEPPDIFVEQTRAVAERNGC